MMILVKRLGLGLTLILLASGILLATDRARRTTGGPRVYRVALLQHASVAVLDEGAAGVIDALAARGFQDGKNLNLTRYNPQGDVGTSSTMAGEIVNGPNDFDLVITVSTLSLQAVANANKQRQRLHVFSLVADPFSTGVGLDRADPMHHPSYLVGQGTFLPVAESFRLAKQMYPSLKDVGVVWSPSESNSKAFVERARLVCPELGIRLLEAGTESSAGVLEAAQSVIGRGAQAIWVGGDVSVSIALGSVIGAARKAGIPVFTITPGKPERGTLFDVGINFYECGKLAGSLAADVLEGTDPASVPIRDVASLVPPRLVINRLALKELKDPWILPEAIVRQADILVDDTGVHQSGR